MAVTRIKNNQITDSTITYQKIATGTLVGGNFNANLILNSNVQIVGNLTITGNTSTVNSTNTFINDPLIVFNNGYTGSLVGYDIGMVVNRNLSALAGYPTGVNAAWVWVESDAAFEAIVTTDTGSGITNVNNSGFANVKIGNLTANSATINGALVAVTIAGHHTGNTALTYTNTTNFSTANALITGGSVTGITGSASTFTATNLSTGNAQITSGSITGITGSATTFTATNLSSGNIVGVLTGTASTANVSLYDNITVTATNASYYPQFTDRSTTGNASAFISTGFSVNPSTNTVTATTFVGTHQGTAAITSGSITGITGQASTFTTTNFSTGNAVITGGSLNNTTIGATTPTTAAFTTANATNINAATIGNTGATLTGTLSTASQPNVTTLGNLTSLSVAGQSSLYNNVTGYGSVNSFGDLVGNATFNVNATRSLNLVGNGAVMRVARTIGAGDPAVELVTMNAGTGAITDWWDFFLNGDTFQLRRRSTGPGSGAGNILLQASQSGVVVGGQLNSNNAVITSGSITGITGAATTFTATNFSSGNAQVTGGSITGITGSATTLTSTNFSSGNAQVTGGSITGITGSATTFTSTNFSTGNAVITGGTTGTFANVTATTGLSTANALITGGSVTGITGQASTFTANNFSTGNAVITGGSTGTFNYITASTGLSTANALITGGSVTGITGQASTFTATNFSSGNIVGVLTGTASTANVSLYDNVAQTTTNATFYPQFTDRNTTGNSAAYVSPGFMYNPSSNLLTTSSARLTNTSPSTGASDGALVVDGGAYFGQNSFFNGNITVSGNLVVTGNTTFVNSQNLQVNDTLIYLGVNNPGDAYEIGIIGHRTAAIYQHLGLVRDHTDGVWKFFSNVVNEPNGNLITFDTTTIYDAAKVGALIVANNTPATSITTGAVQVAGGLSTQGNIWATRIDGTPIGEYNRASVNGTYIYAATGLSTANAVITGGSTGTFNYITASTGLSTANALITGGSVTGITGQASTLTATNFSTANAQLTGGSITNFTGQASTFTTTNFSTGNAVITGGSTGTFANITATTGFNTGNALITGGSITGITGASTTFTANNFSSGNAQITGGSVTGITGSATTLTATNFSTGNAQITGGSVTGITGSASTFTATNFSSGNIVGVLTGTASTANVALYQAMNYSSSTGTLYMQFTDRSTTGNGASYFSNGFTIQPSTNTINAGYYTSTGNGTANVALATFGDTTLVNRFIRIRNSTTAALEIGQRDGTAGYTDAAISGGHALIKSGLNKGFAVSVNDGSDFGNIATAAFWIDNNGNTRITGTQTSIASNNGALTVIGGAGVGGNVYAGGDIVAANNVTVGSGYYLNLGGTATSTKIRRDGSANGMDFLTSNASRVFIADSDGAVTVKSVTASTSANTGALIVAGGVGITGVTNTTGNINIANIAIPAITFNSVTSSRTASIGMLDGYNIEIVPGPGNTIINRNGQSLAIGGNTSPVHKVAVNGDVYAQTNIVIAGTTTSVSNTTGAFRLTGGAGIGGNVTIGGNLAVGTTQTNYVLDVLDSSANSPYGSRILGGGQGGTVLTVGRGVGGTGNIQFQFTNSYPSLAYLHNGSSTYMYTGYIGQTGYYSVSGSFPGTAAGQDFLQVWKANGNVIISSNTISTSTTTGALTVGGGVGIIGNVWLGANTNTAGSALFNTSQTAGNDFIVRGKNDATLIWARPNATYDQVIVGNSAVAANAVTGAKLQINSTDSILLPVGTQSQRPGLSGGTDVYGMMRYSTSANTIEWYTPQGWLTPSGQFTVISDDQFVGDGVTTSFTLTSAQTTNSCIVSINGIVQVPILAYSVGGVGYTLTFTAPPDSGDVIDVRKLTTTFTVTTLADTQGYNALDVDNTGVTLSTGTGSKVAAYKVNTNGAWVPLKANTAVASANTATAIDSFATNTYRSAIYKVQSSYGGNYQIQQAFVVHNDVTPYVTIVGTTQTGGNLGTVTASISTGTLSLNFVAANANTNVRISKEYIPI